jgi:CRP-like cAMP-binding protein
MVSPELIRRYPFFAGLTDDQIKSIAMLGEEQEIAEGEVLFEIGDAVSDLYLVEAGEFGIFLQATDHSVKHTVAEQLMRQIKMEGVLVSRAEAGEVLGWSALIPPHEATGSAKALKASKVITLRGKKLQALFEEDRGFECQMIKKVAQVIRQRLADRQIETIAAKIV